MKKLFSRMVQVAEDRAVSVIELPESGLSIEGLTHVDKRPTMIDHEERNVSVARILLHEETIEALRQILNEWHDEKNVNEPL